MKKILLILFAALVSSLALAQEATKTPVKIGEIFSYSAVPDVAQLWRNGWQLALDEINKSGGVLGKPLEVVSRDDKGNPAEAIKILEEYKSRENINIFFGTVLSHIGLAASNFAKQSGMLMIRGQGGSSKQVFEAGHDLFFQIEPPGDVWTGSLAEKAAKTGKKRWAIISADFESGHALSEHFMHEMKRLNPDVELVETQWFPIGKLDAGAVAQAIAYAKPDGIFTYIWGSDYMRLVREGNKRSLFDNRLVVSPFAGYTGYIEALGKEAPIGWLSADGYPAKLIAGTEQKAFNENYKKAYGTLPYIHSFYGYCALKILAEAINEAGTDDAKKVADVIRKKEFKLPGGAIHFRADGISSLGAWIGKTGFNNGIPTILNPEYVKPEKYLPTVEENMKLREEKRK